MWALYFAWVRAGSFKAELQRMLFLLGLWLTPLALAIGAWTGVHGFTLAGGYLGLIAAVLAAIASGFEIITYGSAGLANEHVRPMPQVVRVPGSDRCA